MSYTEAVRPGGVPPALSDLLPTEARVLGPAPSFDSAQLLFAFLKIGEGGRVGRHALAKRAGLGDGAVRTVLKRFRERGLVQVDASGCYLTASGLAVYRKLNHRLVGPVTLGGSELTPGRSQVAFAVRGAGRLVKGGIEQRDSAVKAGASGATTYVIRRRKFTIPGGSSDCEREFPSAAWKALRSGLSPRDGDAVILCGSDDEMKATFGSLSAALTLL